MTALLLFCTIPLVHSPTLSLQISLDRAGFSSNAIDGQWGRKSQSALSHYVNREGTPAAPGDAPSDPSHATALARYFSSPAPLSLFRRATVTAEDLASLVRIPTEPAEKARLPALGYESLEEMFAERGHVTVQTIKRLNPGIDFTHVRVGTEILLPDFPTWEETLRAADRPPRPNENRPRAATLRISLSRFEISAFDDAGEEIALFPCSIARDKSKRPPNGELRIVSLVARPNYTYTPDAPAARGSRPSRHILPPGPNNPVGVAWIGLSLPGYGIHGTPTPERIGRAESHGCFRLANWNAARLYALCRLSTRVFIDP